MLFYPETNDWGELAYIPTSFGNAFLISLIMVLILSTVLLAPKSDWKLTTRQLVFCSLAVGLGAVLSNIKLFHFPTGGAITLFSMLAVTLPGYWFGPFAGILAGCAHGILQLLIDPYILFPSQAIIDYLLAFGALGLSGLFAGRKKGLIFGYIAGILGRYFFAVISGWIFFGTYAWEGWGALPYSLVYNAIYIFAEAAVTVAVLMLSPVQNAMNTLKRLATE